MAKIEEIELKIGNLIYRVIFGADTAAKRAQLAIEDYIVQQRMMGMSDAEILANLNDDLKTDRIGFFKSYKRELRDVVTGAIHHASSLGQFVEYAKNGVDKEFRWVAVGDKRSCDDCLNRHGRIETLEDWEMIGLPASGFSVCNERCRCILEPAGIAEHGEVHLHGTKAQKKNVR